MQIQIGKETISVGGTTYHCKVCKCRFYPNEKKEMQDPKEHNQYQPHGKPFKFIKLVI